MDDDYAILNELIETQLFHPTKWYDYYTLWSAALLFLTLIFILIDQFKEFLPGWWIAFVFANTIFVGVLGTLIVTVNSDHQMNQKSRNRLEYAYSQLFLHTIPLLIAGTLLLLFPTILKPFQVWQVIVAFVVIFGLYLVTPSSHQSRMFLGKLNQVYFNPNMFLMMVTGLSVIVLMIYIEKRLIEMHS